MRLVAPLRRTSRSPRVWCMPVLAQGLQRLRMCPRWTPQAETGSTPNTKSCTLPLSMKWSGRPSASCVSKVLQAMVGLTVVVGALSARYVDLLKIDVEGCQCHVLRSAKRALAEQRVRFIMIEVTPMNVCGCNHEASMTELLECVGCEAAGASCLPAAVPCLTRIMITRAASGVPPAASATTRTRPLCHAQIAWSRRGLFRGKRCCLDPCGTSFLSTPTSVSRKTTSSKPTCMAMGQAELECWMQTVNVHVVT